MKVLIVDRNSMCLDFALRVRAAGHELRWWVGGLDRTGDRNPVGDGFGLTKVPHWEPSMRWADLVFLPDNDWGIEEMDVWRRKGFPIFGPNVECSAWERDRGKGQAILDEVGIKTAPFHPFKRLSEAETFLRANLGRYVSKPDTDDCKALSYVSKSAKDMAFMLEYWKKNSKVKGSFIFQEFVPGVEVAVGGWFGPGGFLSHFLENFEHKKLMNGDVGVNTGEMGTVMRYTKESALAEYLLRPLEGHLYRAGYTGFIDVSVIVAKDGTPLPLEFTTRPGWPLFQIQQSLHPDPCEWMLGCLHGMDLFAPSTQVAVGVVMAIPDFPYSKTTKKEVYGYPLYGWDTVREKNLHYANVMMGSAPSDNLEPEDVPVTAGDFVVVVSGNGPSVCAAKKAAYRNLKKIELPNSPLYRTDIGDRLEKCLPLLQSHDWCEGWIYE